MAEKKKIYGAEDFANLSAALEAAPFDIGSGVIAGLGLDPEKPLSEQKDAVNKLNPKEVKTANNLLNALVFKQGEPMPSPTEVAPGRLGPAVDGGVPNKRSEVESPTEQPGLLGRMLSNLGKAGSNLSKVNTKLPSYTASAASVRDSLKSDPTGISASDLYGAEGVRGLNENLSAAQGVVGAGADAVKGTLRAAGRGAMAGMSGGSVLPPEPVVAPEAATVPAAAPTAPVTAVTPTPVSNLPDIVNTPTGQVTGKTAVGVRVLMENSRKGHQPESPADVVKELPTAVDNKAGGQGSVADALGFNAKEDGIDKDLQSGLDKIAKDRGMIAMVNALGILAAGFYGIHAGVDMSAVMNAKPPTFEAEERALIDRAKFRRDQLVRDQEQFIRKGEKSDESALSREQMSQQQRIASDHDRSAEYIARLREMGDEQRNRERISADIEKAVADRKLAENKDYATAIKSDLADAKALRASALALKPDATDDEKANVISSTFSTLIAANPDSAAALAAGRDKVLTMGGFIFDAPDLGKMFDVIDDVKLKNNIPRLYYNKDARDIIESRNQAAPASKAVDIVVPTTNDPEGQNRIAAAIATYASSGYTVTAAQAAEKLRQAGKLK